MTLLKPFLPHALFTTGHQIVRNRTLSTGMKKTMLLTINRLRTCNLFGIPLVS